MNSDSDLATYPEEQHLMTFVGPRAAYYLRNWRTSLPGHFQNTGFNWAAFVVSGLWLPYRKMYRLTIIFYAIVLLEMTAEEILFVGILGMPESPSGLNTAVVFVMASICGLFGNRWYLSHARTMVAEVCRQGLPEPELSAVLAKRGGVGLIRSVGCFLLFGAFDLAVLVLLDITLKPL